MFFSPFLSAQSNYHKFLQHYYTTAGGFSAALVDFLPAMVAALWILIRTKTTKTRTELFFSLGVDAKGCFSLFVLETLTR